MENGDLRFKLNSFVLLYRNYSSEIVLLCKLCKYVPYLFKNLLMIKIYYTLSNNDVANYFLRKAYLPQMSHGIIFDDMKMSLSTSITWFYKRWHVNSTGRNRATCSFWSDSYL
jgi:hypothetical protein